MSWRCNYSLSVSGLQDATGAQVAAQPLGRLGGLTFNDNDSNNKDNNDNIVIITSISSSSSSSNN